MMRSALVVVAIALSSCSTMQYTANPAPSSADGSVLVLYDYPRGDFENLGLINFDYYRPGLREPTVTDALPALKQKVASVGGDALIIRDQRVGSQNNRFLQISAEVLRTRR